MASLLATVTGNLGLVVFSLFFGDLTGLLGLFLPGGRVFRVTSRWWARGVLWSAGIRLSAEFEHDVAVGRFIFMPNHQSLYDIPAMLATLPGETRFLAKQSLFDVPVLGWALRTGGFIPVDRDDRTHARDTFLDALEGLDEGVSILVFPEETRTENGELQPFRRGGFLMSLRSGLSIVPVGILGNYEVRPKDSWRIHPGGVEIHYGRPVSPKDYAVRDRALLMNVVRGEVSRLAALEPPETPEAQGKGVDSDGE
jgi:1-acyl-sn-glycerol-3-phosphate acyltransferase